MSLSSTQPNPYLYYHLTQQAHRSSTPAKNTSSKSAAQKTPEALAKKMMPLIQAAYYSDSQQNSALHQTSLNKAPKTKPSFKERLKALKGRKLLNGAGLLMLGLIINRSRVLKKAASKASQKEISASIKTAVATLKGKVDEPIEKAAKAIEKKVDETIKKKASASLHKDSEKSQLIPTDIEDWAQMALGVFAVKEINEGLNWRPKTWAQALEMIVVLNFISHGVNVKEMKHLPLMAVTIAPLAQATQWVTEKTEDFLDKHNSSIPKWVPKLVIGTLATVGGLFGIKALMNSKAYSKNVIGAESAIVCVHCGEAHIICTTEIGDLIGSMGGSLNEPSKNKKD